MAEGIPIAARIKDKLKHTWSFFGALWGLVVGILVGALVAIAIAALFMIPPLGILAILTLISIACVVATSLSALGELIGKKFSHANQGEIAVGAQTVVIGAWDLNAARATDPVNCYEHGHDKKIAQGSETVSIEQLPAARYEDKTNCDGDIDSGCDTCGIGGPIGTYLWIEDEVEAHHFFYNFRKWFDRFGIICGLISGVGELRLAFSFGSLISVAGQATSFALSLLIDHYRSLHTLEGIEMAERLEHMKMAIDIALAVKDARQIAKDSKELEELSEEAENLSKQARQIETAGGDAQRAERLEKELSDAQDKPFVGRSKAMEDANQNVAKEVDAYQHEESPLKGPEGQPIDHAARDMPSPNPDAKIIDPNAPTSPSGPLITDPSAPTLPKDPPKLWTPDTPNPPPNAGQPLWTPGQANPPAGGSHLILP